jgi:hypothetical protein
VEKIKARKQKLNELKKYENIIKKKTCKKINNFFKINAQCLKQYCNTKIQLN